MLIVLTVVKIQRKKMMMKENDELSEATKTLTVSFDRFIELLQKLCEEVAKLKNKVVRSEK